MKSVRLHGSEDEEEYAMDGKRFQEFFKKKRVDSCGDPNHLIGECPKPPKDKNQRAFVEGSWSDSGEEDDEKVKDKMCLVDHASSEVCSESSYFSDENSSMVDIALDNSFCNANGITHNFSAPRTPQSNGVVERKNRTLQEMSRTMLNEQ
ncbi:retrovirus-related pol polyprotein from transposon TNT 1-94 [Tanacetum coccineum]|uniref:Retrovirus-related pol polyprotein from transposon TNT 1-94 n=1 Tax=Tanacetum coccineum TaxID=301880 RepID=A0ABQ4XFN4_9ASTR